MAKKAAKKPVEIYGTVTIDLKITPAKTDKISWRNQVLGWLSYLPELKKDKMQVVDTRFFYEIR